MLKKSLAVAVLALPLLSFAQAKPCFDGSPVDLSKTGARVLVLGEMHGTNEFADLAKKIVCQLAKTESFVILGLEFPHGEQASINAYTLLSKTDYDVESSEGVVYW
jgi:erythromycin esterase-like protein